MLVLHNLIVVILQVPARFCGFAYHDMQVFSILHTDPKHQGRGAGTMLLGRCVEDATKDRLPIYLNASPLGHGLYLRHQFRDIETMVTDFSKWGAKDLHKVFAMIREP